MEWCSILCSPKSNVWLRRQSELVFVPKKVERSDGRATESAAFDGIVS